MVSQGQLCTPSVIHDSHKPVQSQVTGRVHDSKSTLRREYREWAFREGRKDGDLSPRFAPPTGLVILRMERFEPERVRPIEEWAPEARARLLDVKRTLAWNDVQAALLEGASVQPSDLKASLLAQLRGNGRRLREELP